MTVDANGGALIRPVVIYHGHCPDGAMAAAVVYRTFGGEVDLVPAQYERPMSDFVTLERAAGANVYVVDFSFPFEDLEKLAGVARTVTVLDHHKSAEERFAKWSCPASVTNLWVEIDMKRSGAGIAWDTFFRDAERPALINLVEDYDLWRHKLPGSKAMHAYLRSLDMDVKMLTSLHQNSSAMDDWLTYGDHILRANQQQALALASQPERVALDGVCMLAVNAPLHQDGVGEALGAESPDGVGAMWYWREGRYKVSMRSRSVGGREPVDVQAIASVRGGGGHRTSASFTCAELPWRRRL